MTDFKIFSGSSHESFAAAVAKACKTELSPMIRKKFSCGEHYVKFGESVRGQSVFLVQTCRTGFMNEDLMELFLMIDAARQSFAGKIHLLLPYMAYSRQDKIHEAREGISAKLIAKLLTTAGVGHVITVHLHSDQTQGFFDCPVDNINPRQLFVDYFLQKKLKNAVVVSPDAGGAKSAKKFANELGVPLAIMHKQRPEHNVAEVTHIIGDVKGKIPIIIDDMVDTAGSVFPTKEALIKAGAQDEVYLCFTHPIFSGPAIERLNEANFKEILCTDSLPIEKKPKNLKILSVAPLMGEVIQKVTHKESVSVLHLK